MTEQDQTQNWQNIIWREWRHTEDEEYARHLFDLVAGEPVGREATITRTVMGMVYGGLAGWLISLIGALGESQAGSQTALPAPIWAGAMVGGVGGLLVRLLLERRLSWRAWLARLTFNLSPNELGLLGGVLFSGLIGWLIGWLAGLGQVAGIIVLGILLLAGSGAGVMGWLIGSRRESDPDYLYRYRAGWFWWRERPGRTEVEAALKRACTALPAARKLWAEALEKLEHGKTQLDSPDKFILYLQSGNWIKRFTVAHLLTAAGGEAVAHLQPIAAKKSSPLRRTAIGLLQSIGQETTARLAHQASNLLCPHCLARCGPHSVSASEDTTFTYYGCRVCGQSREFWEGQVVSMLDAGMTAEPVQQDGVVRVNWLAHRSLFDFDRVEIVQATDEEVERFAVQVGNDTDPFRRPRYKRMRCLVGPGCKLSENTLRILRSIFGQVDVGQEEKLYAPII